MSEVSYLKATFASEIKLRKRVKVADSEKYKMVKLPIEQLKQSIQNVLKPVDSEKKLSVETLLGKLFE